MGTRVALSLIFFLGLLLCSSGLTFGENSMIRPIFEQVPITTVSFHRKILNVESKSSSSSTEKDVTTPITTVPLINPMNPGATTTPLIDPFSNPTSPTMTSPNNLNNNPVSPPGGSWCIATQSASQTSLQTALDYACGYGGADCSAIQTNGKCYNPNTLRDHASYAFNDYYQKNPSPTSCNFGGTAIITNIDPSSGSCQYPSTSTSSSVLNTTNPTGARIYGSEPSGPSNSKASMSQSLPILITSTCLLVPYLFLNF